MNNNKLSTDKKGIQIIYCHVNWGTVLKLLSLFVFRIVITWWTLTIHSCEKYYSSSERKSFTMNSKEGLFLKYIYMTVFKYPYMH